MITLIDWVGYLVLTPIAIYLFYLLGKNIYEDIKYNISKGMSFGEALITTPDYYRIEYR
jgi:hypothetical protein